LLRQARLCFFASSLCETFQALVENGANISSLNKNIQTPLHLACANNKGNIIEFLLIKGGNIERQDKASLTPLLLAVQQGRSLALQVLIE
jgi:ankyrin repeat protein